MHRLARPISRVSPLLRSETTSPSPLLHLSRSQSTHTTPHSPGAIRRSLSTLAFLGGSVVLVAYYYDSRSLLHDHVIMPAVRATTDAEQSHRLAVRLLGMGGWLRPVDKGRDDESLNCMLWDKELVNPIGVAAGFDKDAEAIDGLFDLGFGYVEVGSVTPEPQPGNPQPRFFRLPEDSAAINRYGFNSSGHRQTLHRLRSRVRAFAAENPSLFPTYDPSDPASGLHILPPEGLPRSLRRGRLLAVNLGKNKTSRAESNEDYVKGVRLLGPFADVLVVNVSSPNTPGLRGLQGKDFLQKLLSEVVDERDKLGGKVESRPKVVVKIAPDLDEDEIADIARAVRGSGVEGVIVSNTTVKREGLGLKSENQHEVGGLSGAPVKPFALAALKTLRPLLPPSIPIIGCGGISTGTDAIDYAQAGASVVQAYTAFGYKGVGYARQVKDEITEVLKAEGGSWEGLVRDAKAEWSKGIEAGGKSLQAEVSKLGKLRDSPDYVPWEDLLAERGVRIPKGKKTEARAVEDAPAAVPFSASGPPAPSPREIIPAVANQLTSFLGRAQSILATQYDASTSTLPPPVPHSGPGAIVEAVPAEVEDLGPASQRQSAHLAWIDEVASGDRRLV